MGILATPLGYLMSFLYNFINNYFVTIFLFTLIVRVVLFPLSIKSQKTQMDRARLAPKLERLQKKYKEDPKKLQEKQQQMYEKEGISMTGGCLPSILQLVVLFGVIAVIYAPLQYIIHMPTAVINAAATAITCSADADGNPILLEDGSKVPPKMMTGYYKELRMMDVADKGDNEADILFAINNPSRLDLGLKAEPSRKDLGLADDASDEEYNAAVQQQYDAQLALYKEANFTTANKTAQDYYDQILTLRGQFMLGDESLLVSPWKDGFGDISWLWIIPLISGATAFLSSWLSMRYSKKSMPASQPGQGCTTNAMVFGMPLFSLYITFTVPCAVGIYWICSNLISLLQVVVLNKLYDPAKARAQAEAEYEERRRKKAEDKKRLSEARQRDEAEARKAEQALERQREESRQMNKKKGKTGGHPSQNKPEALPEAQPEQTEQTAAEAPQESEPEANEDAQSQ